MAGPWEKFQGATPAPSTPTDAAPRGPWEKFQQAPAAPAPQTARDKARAYLDAHPEAQPGVLSSLANKAGQGFTMGWGDEVAAGLSAVKDTLKHGGSLKDNYELEHAMQQELLDRAGKKTGAAGVAAEVVGGLGGGIGLAKSGATLMRTGGGLGSQMLRGAAEGAAYGGVTGAGTAESDRLSNAGKGALLGGAIGGAAPVVVEGVKKLATPLVSNIHARINPEGYAQEQLAKTVERSGKSAQQLQDELAAAASAGQGDYVLADALGDSGQKQLAGAVKLPGAEKQRAIDALSARSSGMGRKVSGFVDDAFNTHGNTAQEYTDLMEAARAKAGDIRYDAARAGAGPVDLTDTLSVIQDIRDPAGVLPGPTVTRAQSAAPDAVEEAAALLGREGLGDTTAANFDLLLQAKKNIGDIENATRLQGRHGAAGQVGDIKRSLDAALSNASPGYRRANDTFSRMSRPIDAVPMGQKAATSGRAADTINTFNEMGRPAQQGFRVGYADKVNQGLSGPHVGGKINEMLHGDVADEIAALATPGRAGTLNEQLQRAQTMLRTGNQAMGGSPTAELLGQQADVGQSISALGNLASGNVGSVIKDMVGNAFGNVTGNTEAVRNNLIPMLMSRSGGIDLPSIMQAIQSSAAARQQGVNTAMTSGRSGLLSAILGELGSQQEPAPAHVGPENIDAMMSRIPR